MTSAAVPAGHVFGFIVFLMFCLPSQQLSRFPLFRVQSDFTEFGALILPFLYFLLYRRQVAPAPLSRRSAALFFAFVGSLALSAALFAVLYSMNTLGPFVTHNLRALTPFLTAGFVAVQGIKINRQVFLRWFFSALLVSYAVLLLTYLTDFQRVTNYEGFENVSAAVQGGRIVNQNWQFGIIGLFLLLDPLKRAFCKTVFDRWLVFTVALLSLVQMIVGFNRTFLAVAILELFLVQIYIARAKFSVILKSILAVCIAIVAMIGAYHLSDDIQRQIDTRILVFVDNFQDAFWETLDSRTSRMSRGAQLEASLDHLKTKWLFGLKPGEPILSEWLEKGWYDADQVDAAILSLWLRYGLLPMMLFTLFWLSQIADMRREGADSRRDGYWRNYAKGTAVIFAIYVLASVNTSSITSHNAVLFSVLFSFLWRENGLHAT